MDVLTLVELLPEVTANAYTRDAVGSTSSYVASEK